MRGPEGAPEVVMYSDFTCPRCALAWERLAGTPLRVVFRHFALKSKHPRSVALGCAAEAAGMQDGFFAFADAVFADHGRIDDPHLWAHAQSLGLDLDRFEADRRSEAVLARVKRDVQDGLRAGVTSTPTLFVGEAGYPGPPDTELVRQWSGSDTK